MRWFPEYIEYCVFQFSHSFPVSTPVSRANTKDPTRGQLDPSLKDEIGEVEKEEREEKCKDEERGREKQEDEDDEEDGGVELEQRNTDSVFSELLELSHDYVESVDQGASVRGELISQSHHCSFHRFEKRKQNQKCRCTIHSHDIRYKLAACLYY